MIPRSRYASASSVASALSDRRPGGRVEPRSVAARTAAGAPCSSRRVCADSTNVCLAATALVPHLPVPPRFPGGCSHGEQSGYKRSGRDGAVANQRVVRSTRAPVAGHATRMSDLGNHLRLVRAFTVDEHIRKSAQWDSARLVSSLDVGYLRGRHRKHLRSSRSRFGPQRCYHACHDVHRSIEWHPRGGTDKRVARSQPDLSMKSRNVNPTFHSKNRRGRHRDEDAEREPTNRRIFDHSALACVGVPPPKPAPSSQPEVGQTPGR